MQPDSAKQALNLYLDDLTSDEAVEVADGSEKLLAPKLTPADELARVSQLLQNANQLLVDESESDIQEVEQTPLITEEIAIEDKEFANLVETVSIHSDLDLRPLKEKLPSRFQALLFEVAGMTLAVPLVELGGIIQLKELNKLPGKPSWFMGVMLKHQEKYQCVDTAKWIMPEKYKAAKPASLHYTYIVQLGKSPWALACEALADTHELNHDDIKWRSQDNKNPWLAGTVKRKMCALIDAAQLVLLLQAKQPNNAKNVVTE
jgi:purine-binding chemotaxis protein CheW